MVRLDVRWPRHASLYLGGSELCCSVASHRTIRPLSARAHGLYSGCILIWLGSRGWILWQNRRCDGAIPCTYFHHSYLRIVHRAFLLCNHVVALDDFPFPCCIGHRWRVGSWRLAQQVQPAFSTWQRAVVTLGNTWIPMARDITESLTQGVRVTLR